MTRRKEIRDCSVGPNRLVIDEQAMVIEDWDRSFESQDGGLGTIGSTKQGAGAALARKILNRGKQPMLGDRVRLAKDHPDLVPYVGAVQRELEDAFSAGTHVMIEGTQGTGLSLPRKLPERDGAGDDGFRLSCGCRRSTRAGAAGGHGGQKVPDPRRRRVGADGHRDRFRDGCRQVRHPGRRNQGNRGRLRVGQSEKDRGVRLGAIAALSRDQRRYRIALSFSDYISIENRQAWRFEQLTHETRAFVEEVERVANAPVSLISTNFERFGVIDRRDWR
jgi:adenylosuccinate synthase